MRYPERGEVWLVDLGLTAKVRPCVVVSTRISDLDRALITLVPHTTSTRGTEFEIVAPVRFLKLGAFDAQGLVTVPVARATRLLGKLTAQQLADIEQGICRWLQLPCEQRDT
ncbi:MAG TPA: type II toxin-antitoxin system PemK/MazF family toxin [Thermoanaerobaculia bacterium]